MHALKIGDFAIGRVTELEFPAFPATEFFPAATADMVAEARTALPGRISDDGRVVMSFHSFVLRTGRHTILIDTCCGKSRPGREQFDVGKADYLAGLAAQGVKPEDVTHVMCTHLHWDHVGWNTQLVNGEWVPTFPNARYIMAKREYDHWNGVYAGTASGGDDPHQLAFEDSVQPIVRADRAVLVEDDFEFDTGIHFEPCHGHTPGHVVINVASNDERGVFIGDVIHHPIQLMFPELSCRADSDMDASRVSRRALMEKHAETGTIVMPQHFATPSCGHIKRAADAFAFAAIENS